MKAPIIRPLFTLLAILLITIAAFEYVRYQRRNALMQQAVDSLVNRGWPTDKITVIK